MSDVSVASVVSFLDADDLATVVGRVRAERGERTRRVDRDGRTFLFSAPPDEPKPTAVVWVDAAADFDARTVEVFADRCDDRGVDGTLLTTGDADDARETVARAFATDDQLDDPADDDGDPRLLVPPEEVATPLELETLDDLVAALDEADLTDDVIDEYHEPHEQSFEEVLDEVDAEDGADGSESRLSGGRAVALVVALAALAVVAVFVFGPL